MQYIFRRKTMLLLIPNLYGNNGYTVCSLSLYSRLVLLYHVIWKRCISDQVTKPVSFLLDYDCKWRQWLPGKDLIPVLPHH